MITLSFRRSIFLLLLVSLFITIVIGGIGSYFMVKNAYNINYQYKNIIKPTIYMEDIKSNYWMAHALMLQMALDKDSKLIKSNYNRIQEIYKTNKELIALYEAAETSSPEEAALYKTFQIKRQQYQAVNAKALEMDLETTTDESINAFNKFKNENLLPVFYEFIGALDDLNGHVLQVAVDANITNEKKSDIALITIVSIIAASIIALLLAGYFLSNSVMRAVNMLTGFASAIAKNDFSRSLDTSLITRKDEFGDMTRALDTMRNNLKATMAELNKTAKNLAASNEVAQRANEYKSVFLARMSHEIRTPLNAIIGMTYIAQKSKNPQTIEDSLHKITTSSAHLLGIINDILDMSKIEAGKFELINDEFNLEKLLMSVCTVVGVKTEEKEQELLVSTQPSLPSRFIGDGLRLSQVLTNILNNATKFTPSKGQIKLSVSCVERNSLHSMLEFCIEDTGIGLTKEQIGRLFTPFEQADASTSRQFGGTGLGLAICDKIAKLMNGNIRVESEFGKGSRFIITVRLSNSQQFDSTKLATDINPKELNVLVVDASETVCDFFKTLLTGLNISVTTSTDIEKALQLLENASSTTPVNILFFDWNTAKGEGSKFIKEVKTRFGDQIIIVLVSTAKFAEIEKEAKEAGVNRLLPKPIFPSTVVNLLNEVMGAPVQTVSLVHQDSLDLSNKKILLVEDVDINREIVFAYLEDTGVTIDVAENGAEGVEKYLATSGNYDLVLMDIHMPVMDGYTATKRIREEEATRKWPQITIIAMTANAFKEDIERCLDAGMNDHIAKPIDIKDAICTLRKHLVQL